MGRELPLPPRNNNRHSTEIILSTDSWCWILGKRLLAGIENAQVMEVDDGTRRYGCAGPPAKSATDTFCFFFVVTYLSIPPDPLYLCCVNVVVQPKA
jgi:hypothetical protein